MPQLVPVQVSSFPPPHVTVHVAANAVTGEKRITDVAATKSKQIETTKVFRASFIDFSSHFPVFGFYCSSSSPVFGQLFVVLPVQPIPSVAAQLPLLSASHFTVEPSLHVAEQLSANEVNGVKSKKAEAKTRLVQTEILTETSIFFININPPEKGFPSSFSVNLILGGHNLINFFFRCQSKILI
jgi:hypothetical protein